MICMYKYVFCALLFVTTSCNNNNITLCSQSLNRCISIEDVGSFRYIYYENNHSSNYVKLDITGVDSEIDAIFICWKNEYNKIEIINPRAKIQEAKIDTSLYQFSNIHELDNSGIPKILKFHQNDNIEFDMETKSFFPVNANVKLIGN